MDYLTPLHYKILKIVYCFYNNYGKEPKKSQKEPKKSQKEPVFRNLIMVVNMVDTIIMIRIRP